MIKFSSLIIKSCYLKLSFLLLKNVKYSIIKVDSSNNSQQERVLKNSNVFSKKRQHVGIWIKNLVSDLKLEFNFFAKFKKDQVFCIYVLIGQKKSTLKQIVNVLNRADSLKYTVIVAAFASD